MLAYQVVTSWMVQDWKTPGVPEGNQMRLPREEFNIEDTENSDLLSGNGRFVYAVAKGRV